METDIVYRGLNKEWSVILEIKLPHFLLLEKLTSHVSKRKGTIWLGKRYGIPLLQRRVLLGNSAQKSINLP
jgi:hypothetical protein